MWASLLSAKFSLSLSSHYSRDNSPSSTSQPLPGRTLSSTPFNFRLTPSGGIIIYFLQGYFDIPGRSLYYHSSTLRKSREISTPPANSSSLKLSKKEYFESLRQTCSENFGFKIMRYIAIKSFYLIALRLG